MISLIIAPVRPNKQIVTVITASSSRFPYCEYVGIDQSTVSFDLVLLETGLFPILTMQIEKVNYLPRVYYKGLTFSHHKDRNFPKF